MNPGDYRSRRDGDSRRDGGRRDERSGRYDNYGPRRDANSRRAGGDNGRGSEYGRNDYRSNNKGNGSSSYSNYDNGPSNYINDEYRDRARIRYRDRDPRDTRDADHDSRQPYSRNYKGSQSPSNNRRYENYGSRSREGTPHREDQNQSHYSPHNSQKYSQQQPNVQLPVIPNSQAQPSGPSFDDSTNNGSEKPELTESEKEDLIAKYLKKLSYMSKIQNIDEVKIIDSQWDVKPKGFEKVTVQRAKLSGLFPLPGYPRPVDFTKLQDSLQSSKTDLFYDSYKISPLDSKNSKIIIIKNINFEEIDHLRLTDYVNKFLAKIDIPETTLNNVESKRKTKDDKNLIIQFNNNDCATIALALNGSTVPLSQIKYTKDTDEDDEEIDGEGKENSTDTNDRDGNNVEDDTLVELQISRPGEYVTQCLPPYKEITNADIEEKVIDNPRKVTIIVNKDSTETELLKILTLNDRYKIKSFLLLREIGTKESLGVAFIEYFFDPSSYKNTIKVIPAIENIIQQLKSEYPETIYDSFLSCVIPGKTGIEDCPMDFSSLKALAKGEYVTNHPKSKVIELINLVTPKDLVEDSNYKFIKNDILLECKTFGEVVSIKIPRPANDFTPGISQFSQPGLGKVYVEFSDEQQALEAIMGLAGRSYNDRTVLCAFHNHQDYLNGIL